MCDKTSRSISFDKIKQIAIQNTYTILRNMVTKKIGERNIFDVCGATFLIGAARTYIDGKNIMRGRQVAKSLEKEVVKYIKSLDVRQLGEILELLPKGCDNRMPSWLYKGVVASIDDDGWVLSPAA